MDYSTLSDAEINQAVTCALNPETRKMALIGDGSCFQDCGPDGSQFYEIPIHDYCNNPADAWPIILGHKISIINADDEWLCVQDGVAIDGVIGDSVSAIFSDGAAAHQNPLRAAMIVFLMMQESE